MSPLSFSEASRPSVGREPRPWSLYIPMAGPRRTLCRSGKSGFKIETLIQDPPSSKLKFKGGFELLSASLS
eukprot:6804230-Prymnesium_polylepis.1